MTAEHAKQKKIPSAKTVIEDITPLAGFYSKYRPDVKRIAVSPLQMQRIELLLASKNPQGFRREKNGRVYFEAFRLYVVHEFDAPEAELTEGAA